MVSDFLVEADFRAVALSEIRGSTDPRYSMDLYPRTDPRYLVRTPVVTRAPSAALITEALHVGFRLAGSRASAAEVFTVAEATGNPV